MTHLTLSGPCSERESDLADLIDGVLDADRAAALHAHLRSCDRCQSWFAELKMMDVALREALPRLSLSPDFDRGLLARMDALARRTEAGTVSADADGEYRRMLSALGAGLQWDAVANALAALAAVACGVVLWQELLARAPHWMTMFGDRDQLRALVGAGVAVAGATFGWSIRRGLTPLSR
ncbi:MAG TPA: zf-HC2 domain-containing protein [Steroidobacteraceae bacterium]|nr:zf-HC2 domain-containing protein [Steroidobacteraceae bacterium]